MKRFAGIILAITLTVTICLACAGAAFAAPAGQEQAVNPYQVTVYFTDNAGLALRTAPDTEADKYLDIPEGTSLYVDQISSGWGHVTYDGYDGWVSLQYTRIDGDCKTPAPTYGYIDPVYYTVYNTDGEGLELRMFATEKSSTFGPLEDGTVLKVQAQDEDWVYGESDGHYGWCNTEYLRESTADEIAWYEAQNPQTQTRTQTGQTPASSSVTPVSTTSNPGAALKLPEDNGYARAYIDHLNEYGYTINAYDWQKWNGEEISGNAQLTRAVVLSDIYGDETPELIYIAMDPDEIDDPYSQPRLYIMTYENGSIRAIFASGWENSKYAGGYYNYYLFRMKDKDYLYFFRDMGDDGGRVEYGRFDVTGDGTLKIKELFSDQYTDTGYGEEHEYQKQGSPISAESYHAKILNAQENTESILMYSKGCGEFVENYVAQSGCPAMTVDEALTLLSSKQGAAAGGVTIVFE